MKVELILHTGFAFHSKESSDYPDNDRQEDADYDHRGYGKIKSEIFFLYPYVARQPSDPMKFVMKEIDQSPDNDHCESNQDNIFSCVLVHKAPLPIVMVDKSC